MLIFFLSLILGEMVLKEVENTNQAIKITYLVR